MKNVTQILETTKAIFSKIEFKVDAREKVSMRDFFMTLFSSILTAQPSGGNLSINGLRQKMTSILGQTFSRSGFWKKLASNKLLNILETVMKSLMQDLIPSSDANTQLMRLIGVSDILIADSTTSSLPQKACNSLPGTNDNSASIKLHAILSLLKGNLAWVKASAGIDHDYKHFPMELIKTMSGTLLLADLGYYCTNLFNQLNAYKVFFLFRVKSNANVKVTQALLGVSKKQEGKLISSLTHKRGDVIALEGIMEGLLSPATFVGFWDIEEKKYHWYITNLQCELSLLHNVYRLRWQIELLFKGLKTHMSFDEIPSANINIIKVLFYIRIISSFLGMALTRVSIKDNYPKNVGKSETLLRRFRVFCLISDDVYLYIKNQETHKDSYFLSVIIKKIKTLKSELLEPNRRKRSNALSSVKPFTQAA